MQSSMQNLMKTGLAALFMSLFMFSASGAAVAGNGVQADPATEAATEAAPNASQDESALKTKPAKGSKRYSKPKRLPKGDLRHCLELKDSAAIIRCTETGRKNGS